MTCYHIEPVIVPPWTPEEQRSDDPIVERYVRIAECGYRIQWAEDEQPRIDYFKRDKPDDFYPVAGPSTVLEGIYGALIFQLAEQLNSAKDELKDIREWDGDIADLAHDTIMSATCSDDLTPAHVQSLRHAFTDLLTEQDHVLDQVKAERDVAMNEVLRLQAVEADSVAAAQRISESVRQMGETLDAARVAEAEQAKRHGYWYRRACFAEAALQPFSDRVDVVDLARSQGFTPHKVSREVTEAAYRGAHRVLAEARKSGRPEIENLEDYVRNERQRKMHGWALRSFSLERMGIYDRAMRLYEETVELFFAWIFDAVGEDLQIDHGPEASAKWAEIAQNARDHAIRVLDAKMAEPPGKVGQEIGGVALTLSIGAEISGHSVATCEKQEFERVLSKPLDHWTAREAFKQDQGL